MLLGVRFCNFDIFDDDRCGILIDDIPENKNDFRLRNMNALIGRNMTGKTSFMKTMAFIKNCVTSNVADASTLGDRPGFSNLVADKSKPCEFDLYFKLQGKVFVQYELEISASAFGSPVVSGERIILCEDGFGRKSLKTVMDISSGSGMIVRSDGVSEKTEITDEHVCAVNVYGKIFAYNYACMIYREISRWFFCRFSAENKSSYFAEGNAPGGHKHLNSTGSNVNNVLEYIKQKNPSEYDSFVGSLLAKIPTPRKQKKNLPQTLSGSPDRLFLYLLLLHDSNPHSTIFIETPDRDLYHDMVDVLADEMRDFTLRNPYSQIMFTTHNPYIVESMSPREIWVFKREFKTDVGDIVIDCAGSDPVVSAMFKEGVGMGAIWYGGHLDESNEEEEN